MENSISIDNINIKFKNKIKLKIKCQIIVFQKSLEILKYKKNQIRQ